MRPTREGRKQVDYREPRLDEDLEEPSRRRAPAEVVSDSEEERQSDVDSEAGDSPSESEGAEGGELRQRTRTVLARAKKRADLSMREAEGTEEDSDLEEGREGRKSGPPRGGVRQGPDALIELDSLSAEEGGDGEGGSDRDEGGSAGEGQAAHTPAKRSRPTEESAERAAQQQGERKSRRLVDRFASFQFAGADVSEEAEKPRAKRRSEGQAEKDKEVKDKEEEEDEVEVVEMEEEGEEEYVPQPKKRPPRLDVRLVERCLDLRTTEEGEEQVLVKLHGRSYRRAEWVPEDKLEANSVKAAMLRRFRHKGGLEAEEEEAIRENGGIHPDWLLVDRVIDARRVKGKDRFLVKWRGLPYTAATWEEGESLVEDAAHLEAFEARERPPKTKAVPDADINAVPAFRNGRELRDYQKVSLQWMLGNFRDRRNCMLGDEMGLGKTAQSVAVLEYQRSLLGLPGPCLVIAPLTTLGHWQREIQAWTSMNVLLFLGNAAERKTIQDYEFHYHKGSNRPKFDVLLTSYEMLLREKAVLKQFTWQTVIVDEAHKLKSLRSQQRIVLAGSSVPRVKPVLNYKWLLLLTGTPVQNNMGELFGMFSLLNPQKFDDEAAFLEAYGGGPGKPPPTVEQIQALQELLKPVFLRRMKEDVENLPEKEEVIIWVELTQYQRNVYKSILAQQTRVPPPQVHVLLAATRNIGPVRNLAMELRKVCCHPFLVEGVEDDARDKLQPQPGPAGEAKFLVQTCGKMLLLDKLLPKLRAEGHKVLIFSQFCLCLNVLEDYLKAAGYPRERIDGNTSQRDRQAAIDRFSTNGDAGFVFLLSTRAGGQGITLTAADTVVIFDSDWNPQNDLQAQARAHRIGQSKEVKVYRLISRNTFEQRVFDVASRKQGLDHALLGTLGAQGGGPSIENDAKRIAALLRDGAHMLSAEKQDEAAQATADFTREGIDEILSGRTEKRQLGSHAGNTFSTATFVHNEVSPVLNKAGEKAFWAAVLPEAVEAHENEKRLESMEGPLLLGPRRRRQVGYSEGVPTAAKQTASGAKADPDESDFEPDSVAAGGTQDSSEEESDPEGEEAEPGKTAGRKRGSGKGRDFSGRPWTALELAALENNLLAFGHGCNMAKKLELLGTERTREEYTVVEDAYVELIMRAAAILREREKEQFGGEFGGDVFSRDPPSSQQDALGGAITATTELVPDYSTIPAAARQNLIKTGTQAKLLKAGEKMREALHLRKKFVAFMRDPAMDTAARDRRLHEIGRLVRGSVPSEVRPYVGGSQVPSALLWQCVEAAFQQGLNVEARCSENLSAALHKVLEESSVGAVPDIKRLGKEKAAKLWQKVRAYLFKRLKDLVAGLGDVEGWRAARIRRKDKDTVRDVHKIPTLDKVYQREGSAEQAGPSAPAQPAAPPAAEAAAAAPKPSASRDQEDTSEGEDGACHVSVPAAVLATPSGSQQQPKGEGEGPSRQASLAESKAAAARLAKEERFAKRETLSPRLRAKERTGSPLVTKGKGVDPEASQPSTVVSSAKGKAAAKPQEGGKENAAKNQGAASSQPPAAAKGPAAAKKAAVDRSSQKRKAGAPSSAAFLPKAKQSKLNFAAKPRPKSASADVIDLCG